MKRDNHERVRRIQEALADERLDAVFVAAPNNILMLSGYWPAVGSSIGVATKDGRIGLVVPEDERDLAGLGWADEICTFQPASLDTMAGLIDIVREGLEALATSLSLHGCTAGYQRDPLFVPAIYAATNMYGASIRDVLNSAVRNVTLRPANEMLAGLRSTLTGEEINDVREACSRAAEAYERGSKQVRAGMAEWQVADLFRDGLSEGTGKIRRGGYTFCMSGPNSAHAKAAYQLTGSRVLEAGDFALVHCNSYVNGFWTDITRTFSIGEPDDRKKRLYSAVLRASRAAIRAVRPGVKASSIDACARDIMNAHGLGDAFSHATGHGVGFAAIDHNSLPRLHPKSDDVLRPGMVFNIEPAAYFEGEGGIRHCDVVAVTEDGVELLTPFLSRIDELVVHAAA